MERAAIERAVAKVRDDRASIVRITPLSGGCIHHASRVELSDGTTIVAKVGAGAAAIFREESAGLAALAATETVLVPRLLALDVDQEPAVLLMEFIPPAPATDRAWRRLGEDLAALHACDAGNRYGFDSDNHLGSTAQPNRWMDDWVEFNRIHRLGHQRTLAALRGLLTSRELQSLDALIDRLDQFLPRHPKPALLHGDLWSGNALPTVNDRIAVIDPAVSVGDGWADIAMMQLFGGFPLSTFDAYSRAATGGAPDNLDARIAIYQLYHLLNHINIFGRGYAHQAMEIVRRLR